MLEVAELTKLYGETVAVRSLSFTVDEGEVFGLLGPNGAGKTTTISVIATLLKPDGGTVRVNGHDVQRDPMAVRRSIGLVPQEIGLYDIFSAWENLEYFGRLYGLWGRTLKQRIEEALEIAGLTEAARKPRVRAFSGGMKRRLNLAAGLLHRPKLLLLDEPTAGVDPQSRAHILDSIRLLSEREHMTVLYTTHYMEEAEQLCRRVAIVDAGEIVSCDEVQQLLGTLSGVVLEVKLAQAAAPLEAALAGQPGVLEVHSPDGNVLRLVAASQEQGLSALVKVAGEHGIAVEGLALSSPSLEQVFLRLTGKALRD